jgi:hypothetical protein
LPASLPTRRVLTAITLLLVAISIRPGDWGRSAIWLDRAVSATVPTYPEPDKTMILMAGYEPYSHVLSLFPQESSFVRVQSNFASPHDDLGINRLIRQRVLGHDGNYQLFMPKYQLPMGAEALQFFHLQVRTESCRPVRDDLYDSQLVLCDVDRRATLTGNP